MDEILGALIDLGLSSADIANLEKLNDRGVLRRMPDGMREADYRDREHAVTYIEVWADLLEDQLLAKERDIAEQRARNTVLEQRLVHHGEAKALERV